MAVTSYKIRYKLNMYRRYLHWARLECIFVHVPKAAGTSINKVLFGRTLGHYSAWEIQSKFPSLYQKCFTFSIVRNPWDRVLSAYRFARIGRTDSMGVREPGQYRIPEFRSFAHFVCDWLPYQDLESSDFIFKPQSSFVCDPFGGIMVDHLGRVELIDETVSVLSERLGRKIVIENENTTVGVIKDYRSEYVRSEMVEIINSLYLRDVKLFNYSFD